MTILADAPTCLERDEVVCIYFVSYTIIIYISKSMLR
jgi:hypothetical protein